MPRPRSQSDAETLERALLVFWERGYDRTSITDLSSAIGLGPSSIYNAFKNKENLYRLALDHYMGTYVSFAGPLLDPSADDNAAEFTKALMTGAVKLYTTKGQPKGCAMLQSGGASGPNISEACAITHGMKIGLQGALKARFETCATNGDTLAASPRILALIIIATMRGLSQLATDGTSRADLMKIVEHTAKNCLVL